LLVRNTEHGQVEARPPLFLKDFKLDQSPPLLGRGLANPRRNYETSIITLLVILTDSHLAVQNEKDKASNGNFR